MSPTATLQGVWETFRWGYFFIILMSYGKIDNSGSCNCSLSNVTQKHIINHRQIGIGTL